MADAWQSAFVEVVPDFRNFRGDANRQMSSILGDAGDSAGADGSKRFGSSFVGGVGKLAAPIAAAFAAIGIGQLLGDSARAGIDYIQQSIVAASDLSESGNALSVSFGDAADEVGRLGETAAQRLGLSNVAFNEIATQFSAFGKTIAGEGGNVVDVIDTLSTRGADFASVFNIEVADALALFQSGLAGETEPLRKYGIDLSAATVASYAYANGIAEQGKQLTEQQRVQAAYGALMAQTSITQGDFTNTSDQLANQQRILAAEFDNAQARLGASLLPALTTLMQLANDQLVPVLNQVIDQVGPLLGESLAQATPAIAELIVALAPLLPDLVRLATEGLPPVINFLILISPLLIDMAANSGAALTSVRAFTDFLSGTTGPQEMIAKVSNLRGSFGEMGSTALKAFFDIRQGVVDAVNGVEATAGRMYSIGRYFVEGFINGATAMASSLYERVTAPFRGLVSGVESLLKINSPSRVMADIGRYTYQGFAFGLEREANRFNLTDNFSPSVMGIDRSGRMPTGVGASSSYANPATPNVYNITAADPQDAIRQLERAQARAQASVGRVNFA